MSVTIEQDLKEILAKIDQRLDGLQQDINQKFESLQKDSNQKFESLQKDSNQKFESLQKEVVDLKVGQTEIKGEIKTLTEKINGLDERVKNQDFISRGVLVGLILAILGGLAKLFGFVGNP
jgi:SMC interacting uncharacterized protein involved in chromosome segregation